MLAALPTCKAIAGPKYFASTSFLIRRFKQLTLKRMRVRSGFMLEVGADRERKVALRPENELILASRAPWR